MLRYERQMNSSVSLRPRLKYIFLYEAGRAVLQSMFLQRYMRGGESLTRKRRDTLQEIRREQKLRVVENGVDHVVDQDVQHQQSVLVILKKRPKSSSREIALLIGLSQRQVQRVLAELHADGRLIRQGSPRSGSWEIIEQK